MNDSHAVLCRVLAIQDSLLLPEPGERGDIATIRWQHCERWRRSGLPYKGGLFTPGMSTKNAGSLLSALEADGLICGAKCALRRTTIKLTPQGHELARDLIDWLCGGYGAYALPEAFRRVPQNAGYFGIEPWWRLGDLLTTRREEILWCLGAGWCIADSDGGGQVMMSITPAGYAAKRPVNKCVAAADNELKALYAETYADALGAVSQLEKLNHRDIRVLFLKTHDEYVRTK